MLSPKSVADCETSVTRNEHETEDQCADLLKDILVETRGEKGNSLGVPHQRPNREEPAIRLIASHSVWFSAAPDRKTIREQGAIADST